MRWKQTQNVCFTHQSFRFEIQRKIYFGVFFRCNEISIKTCEK